MPGIAPPITLQESLIGNKYPQYNAHLLNHQRLVQSSLDWSLYCPGYLVDAPAWDDDGPLELSAEVPPNFAERRRWMLRGPLKYPFALLPFAAKQGVWSVPYAAVAESMVEHLEPNGRFSRQRVGLANPKGRRLKKTKAARERERAVRAERN